jgi:putative transposase
MFFISRPLQKLSFGGYVFTKKINKAWCIRNYQRWGKLLSFGLHRSTYYHKPKNDAEDDQDFINSIETIIEEFPGYGYRRVTRELHRRVIPVNHKKVQRIMRERGLLRKTI